MYKVFLIVIIGLEIRVEPKMLLSKILRQRHTHLQSEFVAHLVLFVQEWVALVLESLQCLDMIIGT